MYGIYHRICRIYLIIYLFESKLLLIFTNPKRCAAHFSAGGFQLTLFRSGCAKFLRIRIGMRRFLVITYCRRWQWWKKCRDSVMKEPLISKRATGKKRCSCWREFEEGGEACWLYAYSLIEGRRWKWCSLKTKKGKYTAVTEAHKECSWAAYVLWRSRWDWVLVSVSRPTSTRHFSGLFLHEQGIVPMFFSGARSRGCNVAGCANTNVHRPTNTKMLLRSRSRT